MRFQIQHGAAVDPASLEAYGRGRSPTYPFADLEVGDFFHVGLNKDGKRPINTLWSSKTYYEKKFPGRKFQVRSDNLGIRVLRYK